MPHATFDRGELLERLEEHLREEPGSKRDLRLRQFLENVRAEDVAEVLVDFRDEEKISIFQAVPAAKQAEVLDEADSTSREELVQNLPATALATIVQRMPPDEATDLFELLRPEA